jgi:N-acetylglucosamine kinase-like BadF-type ATPase
VALRLDGTVVGRGRTGASDISVGDPADAFLAVRSAISEAIGTDALARIDQLTMRLAGIDSRTDAERWHDVVHREWRYSGAISLLNDGFASIRLGALDGCGMAVTAGTHAAIAARGRDGREFALGWWSQHFMGSYGLGEGAYRRVVLAELGIGETTRLSDTVPAFYGVDTVEELVAVLGPRIGFPANRVLAEAAPLVSAAAAAGDRVAVELIGEQAALFATYAEAVARRVGHQPGTSFPITIGGSVALADGSPFATELQSRLRRAFPGSPVVIASLPAVAGAALDAIAEAGGTVDREVSERLTGGLVAG